MHNAIEISILVYSDEGREVNINDLKKGHIYFEEELTPSKFWGIDGGIEITLDGYKRILRCFEFYVSLNSIDFLINSIFWIDGRLDKSEIDDDFPKCVISRLTTGNILKVCENQKGEILFSYESTRISTFDSKRFFENEIINKQEWKKGTINALNNYFSLVKTSIVNHPNDEKVNIISTYIKRWDKLFS